MIHHHHWQNNPHGQGSPIIPTNNWIPFSSASTTRRAAVEEF
jgi:hypothetical protein